LASELGGVSLKIYAWNGSVFSGQLAAGGADGQFVAINSGQQNTIRLYSADWIGGGAFDNNTVFFVFYATEANPTSVANLAPLMYLPNSVRAFNEDSYAAPLSHLTGRIGVHNGGDRVAESAIQTLLHEPDVQQLSANLAMIHAELNADIQDDSPGVKIAAAPRSNSGRMVVQINFQELLRDPIDGNYADDEQIVPTNSLSTKTGAGSSALTLQEGTVEIITNRLTSEH